MQSSYLLLNDLRVHYLHWNLADGRRPVVLLHDLASNARTWELVAPHLADAGLLPLAPDARGHGLTDQPDGDYGFDTYLKDLRAFIEACNLERPVLVGHSWGALLALDYAARVSFGPRAPAGVVLVDGGMTQLDDAPEGSPPPIWEQVRDRLAPPYQAGMPLADFLDRLGREPSHWQPEDPVIPILLANFEISAEETILPRLSIDHHMQIVRSMWEFPTYQRFQQVRCPVLLAPARPPEPHSPGEKEILALQQRGIKQAQKRAANLSIHWMADSSHDIPLQRPVELAALIGEFAASLAKP
ncbi:MAG TPA: alpha/beta hydrolase [Anaerolineales bacterium]